MSIITLGGDIVIPLDTVSLGPCDCCGGVTPCYGYDNCPWASSILLRFQECNPPGSYVCPCLAGYEYELDLDTSITSFGSCLNDNTNAVVYRLTTAPEPLGTCGVNINSLIVVGYKTANIYCHCQWYFFMNSGSGSVSQLEGGFSMVGCGAGWTFMHEDFSSSPCDISSLQATFCDPTQRTCPLDPCTHTFAAKTISVPEPRIVQAESGIIPGVAPEVKKPCCGEVKRPIHRKERPLGR